MDKGENSIAVEAVNAGDKPNPAGLFFYGYLRQHRKDKSDVVMDFGTDGSWKWSDTKTNGWEKTRFAANDWQPATELGIISTLPWHLEGQFQSALAAPQNYGKVRSVLVAGDMLQVALGRPNREQTVTTRLSAATTLQALELTNGRELAGLMQRGAENVLEEAATNKTDFLDSDVLYARALGRKFPTADELQNSLAKWSASPLNPLVSKICCFRASPCVCRNFS